MINQSNNEVMRDNLLLLPCQYDIANNHLLQIKY